MMLGDISYRFKVPLMLSASIVLTGLVVSLALIWRAYGDLRDDLFQNAVDVGGVLSNTLPGALKHDDLWQAYRILAAAESAGTSGSARNLIVLDEEYRVYVSNRPRSFPVLSELGAQGPELARVEGFVQAEASLKPYVFDRPENEYFYVIIPLVDDDVALGTLIMGYSRTLFLPRFYSIVKRVTYSSLIVLAVLLPFGWYLGNRAVMPLTKLAKCLGKVGRQPLEEVQCSVAEGKDEIGQLGTSFRQMLQELREKQRLEHRMVASERLAAVGRLASAVAHEINNPLGGMLNAIRTFRHHGRSDDVTEKTLLLLERGLGQIGETVAALLVETRSESHALTPQDIDDVYTLLQPDAQRRSIHLRWKNGLRNALSLPSTQVRQILINLSLNAVQATPEGGTVLCDIQKERNYLHIHVDNEGEPIPPERVNRLFEPFVQHNPSGSGLGLWVTYQIVQQLNGKIAVNSDGGHTCFTVQLPLELAA
jgi:signal transduction histidine kinase